MKSIFKMNPGGIKRYCYFRLHKRSPDLARTLYYLTGRASRIAVDDLLRHFKACDRTGMAFDQDAVLEILEDAEAFRSVRREKDFLTKKTAAERHRIYQKKYQRFWKQLPRNSLRLRNYSNTYRRNNLDKIRFRQREAYRQKNNITPDKYQAKLTEDQVIRLRNFYAEGVSIGVLAVEFGVSAKTVYDAAVGRTWKKLPIPSYKNRKNPNRGRHIKPA